MTAALYWSGVFIRHQRLHIFVTSMLAGRVAPKLGNSTTGRFALMVNGQAYGSKSMSRLNVSAYIKIYLCHFMMYSAMVLQFNPLPVGLLHPVG